MTHTYEGMFIVKPDLAEEERKTLFGQITELITRHKGEIAAADVWSEKRRLCFPIKKQHDGVYYLVRMKIPPEAVSSLQKLYRLNEQILRVMFTRVAE